MISPDSNTVPPPRGPSLLRLLPALVGSLLLIFGFTAEASAERAFTPRFSQNVQGAIAFSANTVMTCRDSDSRCAAARAGTGSALNNNQFNMTYVDVDSDPSTFNSSSAELILPTDAQVLFAGLYYGAKTSAGAGGSQAPDTASRGTVKLLVPGSSTYEALTASVDDSVAVTRAYGAFVDVTTQVQSAGPGEYTVADVQAGTGEDRYGGWSLVVAYRDPDSPARNLTIFDGLENVTNSKPAVTIGVSGFQAPATGPVRTDLGFVSFEGDRGATGDSATLNGQVLSSATNPASNFFNSSISQDGVAVTTKDPDYLNQLGYDSVTLEANDFLANGAESAAIRLQTSSDVYLPQVISFATELFSPAISATKSVENVTDPGQGPEDGDVLRYTVTYTNSGGDGATQFTASDSVPAGTTFVPGSMQITEGPNAPASPTDAIGDDLGEYLPESNSIRIRLGQGANETTGGLLTAAGDSAPTATITFEVTVDSGLSSGTGLANAATGSFLSQTLATDQSVLSNDVELEVLAPDLVMSKDHADPPPGGPVDFTLGVANEGSAPTDGPVTVTDSFPAAAFSAITITSAAGWDCSATAGLNLSCTRSDPLAGGASYPPIEVEATVVGSPPPLFENSAQVTGGGDPNTGNNVAVDYLPAPPATSDLAVTKSVDQATVATGARVTWTIVVRNNGPSPATGVTLSDNLPAGADSGVQISAGQGTCEVTPAPGVDCEIGSLDPGSTATVTISAIVTADDEADIDNTASVEGDQIDTRPNNNDSVASFDAAATADLSIQKTPGPEPIAGDEFTYTVTVTNDGPSAAGDLVVNDQIPALFTPTSIDAPDFDCGPLPPAGGTLECLFSGTLSSGNTATVEITGDLAPASAGVPVINTATASSSTDDPDPADNSASVTITPLPFADISVSKVAGEPEVRVGKEVSYLIGVQNLGPTDAESVTVVDQLPLAARVVSLPEGCSQEGGTITCQLGEMPVGQARTLRLAVRPGLSLAGRSFINSVEASSPQPDPIPANNSDRASVTISENSTRLRLRQKVDRKKVPGGKRVRFTITVANRSDSTAFDSKVCQSRPISLFLVKAPRASKSPNGTVCWTIKRLDPGEKRTFSVVAIGLGRRTPISPTARASLTGPNISSSTASNRVRIIPTRRPYPRPVTG